MLAHASQRWVLFAFFFLGLAASIFPHHLCGRTSVQLAGALSAECVGLYCVFLLMLALRVAIRVVSDYAVSGGGWVELIRVDIVVEYLVEGQSRLVGGVSGYREECR